MKDNKKNVLLAVSGSIAAYKAADLARELYKDGISVTVLLTKNGAEFITPLTFETLTKSRCLTDTFDRNFEYEVGHISAAQAADVCVVAPASANIIGKIANGIADDMATTTIMAAPCQKIIAPAMNTAMYDNPIVQENLRKLQSLGYEIIEPAEGLLACDDVGRGKLADLSVIRAAIDKALAKADKASAASEPKAEQEGVVSSALLQGKRVLVTAGPTQEALDPVRFITNHSSGKMGYAIARAAKQLGADVTLISGPVHLSAPEAVETIPVTSAAEMADAVLSRFASSDILIMAAAVADYRPAEVADHKIKKQDDDLALALTRTTDILATCGAQKKAGQFLCGFAMETEDLLANARAKLEKKHLDMIAANSIAEEGAGFAHDTNKITLLTANEEIPLPLLSKEEAASTLLKEIAARMPKEEKA